MREYNINIPFTGLKQHKHDTTGLQELKNLFPDRGYWKTVSRKEVFDMPGYTLGYPFIYDKNRVLEVDGDSDIVERVTIPFTNPVSEVLFHDTLVVAGDGAALVYPDNTLIQNKDITCVESFDARLFYVKKNMSGVFYSMVDGADVENIFSDEVMPNRDAQLNEDGYMYMPTEILQMKRLGDAIVCYGKSGIFLLNEALGMPALGEIHGLPQGIGIASPLSVDGTLYQHVFVGADGNVWRLIHNFTAEKLGYDWLFKDTEPRVQLEPELGYYWIGDYVLTESGLGGPMDWTPRGFACLSQGTIIVADPTPPYFNISLKTNILDMANNGQKRVTFVNVIAEMRDMYVTTYYKHKGSTVMRHNHPRPCSPEGAAFANTVFVYGAIQITGVAHPGDRIMKTEIRYQSHDRRYIRGTRGIQQSGPEE